MRIAILTSSYPRYPGDGTAPFVKSIAEALAKRGHSIEVVAPYDPEVRTDDSMGIKVHRFKYWLINKQHIMGHGRALEADVQLRALVYFLLPFYLLAALITLWRVTIRQQSDVIHVHWVLPNGPVAAFVSRIRGIPLVVSLHGSDIFMAQKNRAFGAMARWVFKQATGVTACSRELRERALELTAPITTELLAWGANPEIFKPVDNRNELRKQLGWDEGIIITALGRMVYKKGFDHLIQALPALVVEHPNIKVMIGGGGPLLFELTELAESLGIKDNVHFLGRVSWNEVPALLAATDIFVLPSIRDAAGNLDGLPTVLLEAMGCGSAVIASDIGGVPLVIRDHENGLLVTPGSVNELTQAMRSLVNDPALCRALGERARKDVVENLNWDNVAYRIEKIFSSASSHQSNEHGVESN